METYDSNNTVFYVPGTDTFYLYEDTVGGYAAINGGKFREVNDKSTIRKLQIQFASEREKAGAYLDDPLGYINSGPLSNPSSTTEFDTYIRYPNGVKLDVDTDYVLFQFGKYVPPFSQGAADNSAVNQYESYNASTNEMTDQTVS